MVQDLLDQLGLTSSADTIVGNAKVRGISGGERKRLSIAVEMISSPSVILLDEPTSGLDSTAATVLIETLRKLADAGKTIIAVIHQPSQHVFARFDDLLLVAEGKQFYFGERSLVRSYMEEQGFAALPEMGTAEHVLDCITRMPFEGETVEQSDGRMEKLLNAAKETTVSLGFSKEKSRAVEHYNDQSAPKASLFLQTTLLLKRSLREVFRGKTAIIIKSVQQITMAIIYGGIYQLGSNQASIQDRFGLLSLIAIGASNVSRVEFVALCYLSWI
jgi:ABC-type multidrug transport system ATPase subunit